MTEKQDSGQAFFDALAGKAGADGSEQGPGIETLRSALRAQVDTMRAAETASRDELGAEAQARMDALKQTLLERGLIEEATKAPASPQQAPRRNWLQALGDFLGSHHWQRPMAIAASLVLAVMVLVQVAVPPDVDPIVVRGTDTPVLIAENPEATAETLTAALTQAGAEVLLVQIHDDKWVLRISLPPAADLAAIAQVLRDNGIAVTDRPPGRINVQAAP